MGYALHALRDGLDVPWHRVVNVQGRISVGDASAITQRLKLIAEGVEVNESGWMDLKTVGWAPGSRGAAPKL